MLREFTRVRQIPGEPFRRWFSSDSCDLIVWYDSGDCVRGFQLLYRVGYDNKALTWMRDKGVTHHRIDDGETRVARPKMTRVLVSDGGQSIDPRSRMP